MPTHAVSLDQLIAEKAKEVGIKSDLAKSIAFCESTNRQFAKNGSVLRGQTNPEDVGVFQINEKYHLERSRALGFDISTTEGNIDYAMWLMKREGTKHWNSSKKCWG